MIKYVSLNDDIILDIVNFVECSNNESIFQHPLLFKILSEIKGFKPFLIVKINDKNNKIEGSLFGYDQTLIKIMNSEYKRALIIDGPLVRDNDPKIIREILEFYNSGLDKNIVYTEIRNNYKTSLNSFGSLGFKFVDHLNYELELKRPLEEIWNSLKKGCRRDIRNAIKNNVQVICTNDFEDIKIGYQLLSRNYKKIGVPLPPFTFFEKFNSYLSPFNKIRFYKAVYNNQVVAFSIRLISKYRMTAWYSTIDSKYRVLRLHDYLYWHSISEAHSMGLAIYDFGGAGKPSVNYGPRNYKSKFNGTMVNYGRYYRNHRPSLMKGFEFGYELSKKVRKIFG